MRHCLDLLRRIGMQISKTGYILFFPFRGARWRRVEEVFTDFPLGAQYYAAAVKV
jgi:hypothetical protein